MRRALFILWLLLAGLPARAATHTVQMLSNPNNVFSPDTLTIDVGDTVIWRNDTTVFHDTVHDGPGPGPVWRSPLFRLNTFQFVFNVAPGTYHYHCTPHQPGMVGTITVRPANTAPTATITSPTNNSTFNPTDVIPVNVTATDNVAVARVELLLDGTVVQTDTAAPFQFSLTLTVGAYKLQARAFDGPGLSGLSGILDISVARVNVGPVTVITSPTNGANFGAAESVSIDVSAIDEDGVDHVEFFVDDVSAGVDAEAPYTLTRLLATGPHVLKAKGFDRTGLAAESAQVSIGVAAPPPKPPQVFFLAPRQGDYLEFPRSALPESGIPRPVIVLTALGFDPDADGSVTNVEFLTNSVSAGNVASFSGNQSNLFNFSVALPEGTHTVTARATDKSGADSTNETATPFTILMAPEQTMPIRAPGKTNIFRLGFFGSSGLNYIFEYSTNALDWVPFRTNVLYRRILFFDVTNVAPMRIYRMRSPAPGS